MTHELFPLQIPILKKNVLVGSIYLFIYFIMTETKVCLVRMNYAPFSWVSQQKLWLVEAV